VTKIDDSASTQRGARHLERAAGTHESQNAIALLKADHRQVEKLFKAFKAAKSAADQQPLAKQICTALKTHMQLEEEIFYPAFIGATGDKELHNEALVEHQSARTLIDEIESSVGGDPLFEARVTVLAEMIKHHVKEEESFKGMFLTARVAKMDLRALGALLQARKRELEAGDRRSADEPEVASTTSVAELQKSRNSQETRPADR
jgi:hemerythrin superfamily protein